MFLTQDTYPRLEFKESTSERRVIVAIGFPFCAICAVFFYFAGDDEARLFSYVFGAAALFVGVAGVLRSHKRRLILDRERNEVRHISPKGPGRRGVQSLPLDAVDRIELVTTGNATTGFSKRLDFFPAQPGFPPLRVQASFMGMSMDDIHACITQWQARSQ